MKVKIASGHLTEAHPREQFRKQLEETYNTIMREAQLIQKIISPMITQIIECEGQIHVIVAYDFISPPPGMQASSLAGLN